MNDNELYHFFGKGSERRNHKYVARVKRPLGYKYFYDMKDYNNYIQGQTKKRLDKEYKQYKFNQKTKKMKELLSSSYSAVTSKVNHTRWTSIALAGKIARKFSKKKLSEIQPKQVRDDNPEVARRHLPTTQKDSNPDVPKAMHSPTTTKNKYEYSGKSGKFDTVPTSGKSGKIPKNQMAVAQPKFSGKSGKVSTGTVSGKSGKIGSNSQSGDAYILREGLRDEFRVDTDGYTVYDGKLKKKYKANARYSRRKW